MPAVYRHGWAAFVLGQLSMALRTAGHPSPTGAVIEIHAADEYVDTLRPVLSDVGAILVDPVDAHSLSETFAWYDVHLQAR
jgi:hypothetical protein